MNPIKLDANDSRPIALQSNVNRRFVYVVRAPKDDASKREYFVYAEPPPDTALTSTTNAAASIQLPQGVSAEASLELATQIVDLTKRTQIVVLLRDTAFRLAEARANGFITDDTYKERMAAITDAAFKLASGQPDAIAASAQGVRKLTAAVADASKPITLPDGTTTRPAPDPQKWQATLNAIEGLNETLRMSGGDGTDPR